MNELQLKVEELRKKISPSYGQYVRVDEGWYQIIVDCDNELTAIDPNYKVLQIKEKFGGLRYYMSPSNDTTVEQRDAMHEVVSKYEKVAARTCEATGKPGVLMKSIGGWLKTLDPQYAASVRHYARYSVVTPSIES
jgi:hypothetical protein